MDSDENQAYADLLVAIEADDAVQSGYTFYGRLVNGDAHDDRERFTPGPGTHATSAGGVFQEAYLHVA